MTLIIGIFTRDIHDKKEIIFASDGLAVTYKNMMSQHVTSFFCTFSVKKLVEKWENSFLTNSFIYSCGRLHNLCAHLDGSFFSREGYEAIVDA